MKRLFLLLPVMGAWLAAFGQQAQPPAQLVVQAGHTSFFARPGVTAAYAMDASIAQAQAAAGGFQITGNSAGQTSVMLVTISGMQTISVLVPAPKVPMKIGSGGDLGVDGQTVEYGTYDIHYNNDPNQFTSMQNLTQVAGDRQIHIQIMNSDSFPSQGQSPVGFPLLSYEISRPGQSITLVDEMMQNTNLTMNGILLRGLHLRQGAWEFHAGVTSITEFQDFLLPSNRYEVAGISRHFELSKRTAMEANLYYFNTNTSLNPSATPGPLATFFYEHLLDKHTQLSAEFGVGRGIALAGKFMRDTPKQTVEADLHYQSSHVASLDLNELHGRSANVVWERKFGHGAQTQFFGNDTDINSSQDQQIFDTATLNQTYWLTHHFGANAGLTASRFISILPAATPVRSYGYLAGPQFQWGHFGGAFVFQNLHNSGNTPSSTNYQASAQVTTGPVSTSAFYNLQTQTPVFAPVQSSQPALQQQLRFESAMTHDPAQMIGLLHQASALIDQGYVSPLTVSIAAKRQQYGSTIDWASAKAGHMTFNALVNTSTGGSTPDVRLETTGVIWTRRFGEGNTLNAGVSVYKSSGSGQTSMQPLEQISFRHNLNSVPRWLVPGRRGSIDGHVFVDAAYDQNYSKGAPPVPGALVYLDGRRSTHTDKSGYFSFRGVPYGVHTVEVDYRDSRPFYFTSSSPKSVVSGGSADFGISYAQGRIFGKFTSDAGDGLEVGLVVEGGGVHREVTTAGDGSIEIDGLPDGSYTIHAVDSTLPPGYSLANLDDRSVTVNSKSAGHFAFVSQAQRSISGAVEIFDPTTGKHSPLASAEVRIAGSDRCTHTDAQGRYLFRQMPAGSFVVSVTYAGKPYTRAGLLASGPDIQGGIDIAIPVASTSQHLPPARPVSRTRE